MNGGRSLLLTACLIGGCGGLKDDRVIAQVDGTPITMKAFREAQARQAGSPGGEVFRHLLLRTALVAKAYAQGVQVSDEEITDRLKAVGAKDDAVRDEVWRERVEQDILIEKYIAKEIDPGIQVTGEAVTAYYEAHPEIWKTGRRVKFRQIVVKTRGEAEVLRDRLTSTSLREFTRLAKERSIAPERETGGVVGTFEEEDLPPWFAPALKTLAVGEVSPVVESPFGFHIFQVMERQGERFRSLEEVRDRIVERLREEGREQALWRWFHQNVKCSVDEEFAKLIGWQPKQ